MSQKLLKFQRRVEAISKIKENPYFKSKYFDINSILEVIKPILNELELILIQPLTIVDGKNALKTIILDPEQDLTKAGVDLQSIIFLPDNIDPQKMGAAITYYRRYAIQSLLCLQAEDDDAKSIVHGKEKQLPTVASVINKIKACKTKEDLVKANKWATTIGYNKNQVNVITRVIEEKEKEFNQ